jgi:eukaryotic-like serine/threonine-protein kinase
MVELSAEQIAQRAFDLDLIDERQLQELWGQIGSRQLSGDEFQQLLLRRELLTNYQTDRLLRGDRSGFFYGDYKVLYLIGTGTFARVYRASHKTTGEIVALKVLRRRFAEDAEQADRFYREGVMGATLVHPNIVRIMEVASQGESHYLVMKFIEGRNLREFIKIRKKFDPPEATRLMADVAAGLNYAFQRGICHRDLKMSNVLVSSRGQAMLLDFGLAAADKNQSDDALANSPNPRTIDYAGLERATGVRKDDQRSDIYFLGCIYYHMLTGNPPIYETKDRIQRLSKSRFQDVVPIAKADPSIPKPIMTVVNRAMELNPSERYQNPGEMLADLKSAMQKLDQPYTASEEEEAPAKAAKVSAVPRMTLMFVESNGQLQDIIRERLKNNGYRVLVTRDPERALARFSDATPGADCVIFSTGELGEAALDAFNRFGENEHSRGIPAILLLGENQLAWKSRAKLNDHRVVVSMPIKLRQLREQLAKLVPKHFDEPQADEPAPKAS